MLVLTACDTEYAFPMENTIILAKNGTVIENLTETFEQDYYDADELKNDIETAISNYCDMHGGKGAELKSFNLSDQYVLAQILFDSSADMSDFQNEDVFFGTVSEAYDEGYLEDISLKSTSDGTMVGKAEIMDDPDKHIFIIGSAYRVDAYTNIAFVSQNVEVIDENSARVTEDSTDTAFFLLTK